MPKSPALTISQRVLTVLTNAGWSAPTALPSTAWMQDADVPRLKKVLSSIAQAKARESLDPNVHQRLLAQLLQRSPKKTGTLFEVVMRDMHGMQRGRDVSHDAVHGSDRVEIKGSRVISQTDAAATNLFDCLLGEERFFAPVQQALTLSYDCNIQQVKARSFDRLLYCLYFSDAIVEFEMTSAQLQGFNTAPLKTVQM